MPAPVPIEFRYDDAGVLAKGAEAVGSGQAYNQQRLLDAQFLNSELDRRQRAQQDAYRLQTASALQNRQLGSPTQSRTSAAGPFARVIHGQLPQPPQPPQLPPPFGLGQQDLAQLNMAKEFGGTSMSGPLLAGLVPGTFGGAESPSSTAKRAFLQTMVAAGAVPQELVPGLSQVADDPEVDLNKLRQAITSVQGQVKSAQDLDARSRTLRGQIDSVTKELTKANADPALTSVADLQPQIREPGGYLGENFRRFGDLFVPGTPFTDISTPGSAAQKRGLDEQQRADALAKREQLIGLQAQLSELEKKRGALGTSQAPTPTTTGTPLTDDLARQFLQQAGGDKDKARELARQSGYSY